MMGRRGRGVIFCLWEDGLIVGAGGDFLKRVFYVIRMENTS